MAGKSTARTLTHVQVATITALLLEKQASGTKFEDLKLSEICEIVKRERNFIVAPKSLQSLLRTLKIPYAEDENTSNFMHAIFSRMKRTERILSLLAKQLDLDLEDLDPEWNNADIHKIKTSSGK